MKNDCKFNVKMCEKCVQNINQSTYVYWIIDETKYYGITPKYYCRHAAICGRLKRNINFSQKILSVIETKNFIQYGDC